MGEVVREGGRKEERKEVEGICQREVRRSDMYTAADAPPWPQPTCESDQPTNQAGRQPLYWLSSSTILK